MDRERPPQGLLRLPAEEVVRDAVIDVAHNSLSESFESAGALARSGEELGNGATMGILLKPKKDCRDEVLLAKGVFFVGSLESLVRGLVEHKAGNAGQGVLLPQGETAR